MPANATPKLADNCRYLRLSHPDGHAGVARCARRSRTLSPIAFVLGRAFAWPPIRDDRRSALVLKTYFEFDSVLDDLAVFDRGRRLHDLDRANVSDRARRRRHGLTRRVAPRPRARPDHLPDDDDSGHRRSFVRAGAPSVFGGPGCPRRKRRSRPEGRPRLMFSALPPDGGPR